MVLALTEEEAALRTDVIAGLEYFLDVFIVQEMMADFDSSSQTVTLDERMRTLIHYAEYDA